VNEVISQMEHFVKESVEIHEEKEKKRSRIQSIHSHCNGKVADGLDSLDEEEIGLQLTLETNARRQRKLHILTCFDDSKWEGVRILRMLHTDLINFGTSVCICSTRSAVDRESLKI
jgi:regulation of enolase protein 1 (concanavalin A-like superfamily)